MAVDKGTTIVLIEQRRPHTHSGTSGQTAKHMTAATAHARRGTTPPLDQLIGHVLCLVLNWYHVDDGMPAHQPYSE
jgi:hypothetical protein